MKLFFVFHGFSGARPTYPELKHSCSQRTWVYIENSRGPLCTLNPPLGAFQRVNDQFAFSLELWPNEAMPNWLYGGFLASNRKDSSTAERYLRKAVEIEPKNQWANYYLGKHLLYWDRLEEAKRFLTIAARLGHSKALELLRWIEDHAGKFPRVH